MGDKKYCLCCGEDVPYYIVERDEKREYACSFCGFTLEVERLWEDSCKDNEKHMETPQKDALSPQGPSTEIVTTKPSSANHQLKEILVKEKTDEIPSSSAQQPDIPEPPEVEKPQISSSYAIIAEDSEFLRVLLKKLILKKSLAEEVIDVSNGLELVAEYTKLINEKARLNFAIVDIHMPDMDGLTATRIIRALEDKNAIKRAPVVFFSAVRSDENLKNHMKLLEPAHYINKGTSPSPQALSERVEVLLHFLTYRYKSLSTS